MMGPPEQWRTPSPPKIETVIVWCATCENNTLVLFVEGRTACSRCGEEIELAKESEAG
jgi:hypothetical protein